MADEQFEFAGLDDAVGVFLLDDAQHVAFAIADDAAVAGRVIEDGGEHSGAVAGGGVEFDQTVQRLEAAREMGLVLRYVARFDANGKARVGVEAVREEHPLAALLPCDNVFAIESRWYRDNPLVIRGPGAGRDVTAGAIQSDINRLAQLL